MVVNPVTQTVLDVPPYNEILVMCNATQPLAVAISKRVSWEQTSPSGTTRALNHDGININIISIGQNDPASASVISLFAGSSGRWTFTCNSSIQAPGDAFISYSQTAEVIVKGVPMSTIIHHQHTLFQAFWPV